LGKYITPIWELGPIPHGHIVEVLSHLDDEVVLSDELGIAVRVLNEMLLMLVILEKGITVVGRVIDDAETKLNRDGMVRTCDS
jgi:hypothetical protein